MSVIHLTVGDERYIIHKEGIRRSTCSCSSSLIHSLPSSGSSRSDIDGSYTMATSSAQAQSTGFVGNVDWADYMKYRPEYPQEFYERIYKQVKLSGGSYDVVNGMAL